VDAPPWEHAEDKDLKNLRMAVYVAQIDRVDQANVHVYAWLPPRYSQSKAECVWAKGPGLVAAVLRSGVR
jgi:hypothetical protein